MLVFLTERGNLWLHPCCCTWLSFALFYGCVIFLCVCALSALSVPLLGGFILKHTKQKASTHQGVKRWAGRMRPHGRLAASAPGGHSGHKGPFQEAPPRPPLAAGSPPGSTGGSTARHCTGNPGTRSRRACGVCSVEGFRSTAKPIRVRLLPWPSGPSRSSNTPTPSLPPGLGSLWVSVLRSLCLRLPEHLRRVAG